MSFAAAVAALLTELGERIAEDHGYVDAIGAVSVAARHRLGIRRDGDEIVRWVGVQRGELAEEITETGRWDERGFVDLLLEDGHLRGRLGLPAPGEDEQIERMFARLADGHRYRSSGADDGGRSDRGISGGSQELWADGDGFVLEQLDFHQPRGGELTERRRRDALTAAQLRDRLATDNGVRVLVGLAWR